MECQVTSFNSQQEEVHCGTVLKLPTLEKKTKVTICCILFTSRLFQYTHDKASLSVIVSISSPPPSTALIF